MLSGIVDTSADVHIVYPCCRWQLCLNTNRMPTTWELNLPHLDHSHANLWKFSQRNTLNDVLPTSQDAIHNEVSSLCLPCSLPPPNNWLFSDPKTKSRICLRTCMASTSYFFLFLVSGAASCPLLILPLTILSSEVEMLQHFAVECLSLVLYKLCSQRNSL